MQISNYTKMNYDQLAKEIEKQTKKIKTAQETIKLLKKLQIAESANSVSEKSENMQVAAFEETRLRNEEKSNNGISHEVYR